MPNALIHESSPYLLQHANNPVEWVAWSEEVFIQAKKENKPVLVSIGYSSCHWCHVMEHESFEDKETAALMNQLFICVKIDREERPDIDHIYMDAVQAMTGSGGWPLHVFVNSEKKPFYGGTYFPPTRMYNRASWKETLINVSQYYTQNRNEVELQADKLYQHLITVAGSKTTTSHANTEVENNFDEKKCTATILALADKKEGGFGTAPKFPSTHTIKYLLHTYTHTHNEEALAQATLSLDKMMSGGIYDHIGGGFSRYSTDNEWLVPHFEKMLYDNALLIEVYAIAYHITKFERYRYVIKHTIDWLMREMYNGEGGFYSAQDADSEGIEGKYYLWHIDEINKILGLQASTFCEQYQISEAGNLSTTPHAHTIGWEQKNCIHLNDVTATPMKDELLKLLFARNSRVKPLTDDKIILNNNTLLIHALSIAGLYLNNQQYLLQAEKSLQYVLQAFKADDGFYCHTLKNNVSKINAFADDMAFLVQACITVAMHTANTHYLHKAYYITTEILNRFCTADDVWIQYTQLAYKELHYAKYDIYDGALPSVNAIMAKNLYYLGFQFQQKKWLDKANIMCRAIAVQAYKYPTSFSCWNLLALIQALPPLEIYIVGNLAKKYFAEIYTKTKQLNVIYIASVTSHNEIESLLHKGSSDTTAIYICKNQQCFAPCNDVQEALEKLV